MNEQNQQPSVRVGAAAPDITLRDSDGVMHAFSAYWSAQPTAIVFVRHFG